jgi:iron complex transport system ATP-binding protein
MTLELRAVSYAYESLRAVNEVSAKFGDGELVALTGPNGSGKSTLLKLIARVLAPRAGAISFEGRTVGDWPAREYARLVGYLPQDPDPVFPMRAIDVVVSGRAPFLTRFGWESDADYDEAARALAVCDASHLAERYLDEMSGGERKRVFVARVLAASPRVVLLDEPFASLDLAHMQQTSVLLRDVVTRTGATVLYATHDLNWAAAYSDRMLVMNRGALAVDATPAELMKPEMIREHFGFDAQAIDVDGRAWLVPRL